MSRKIEMVGRRFGRLLVVADAPSSGDGRARFGCQCDCGKTKEVLAKHLRSRLIKSCGCLRSETTRAQFRRHGESNGYEEASAEYKCWAAMKKRCTDPNQSNYKNYGGRGITVCSRWIDGENGASGYECFLADIGRKPTPEHSIDRKENNGNYEPGNCRWATRSQQRRNQRGP